VDDALEIAPDAPRVTRSDCHSDHPAGIARESRFRRNCRIGEEITQRAATHAAWRSKASFYAVSTEDRTINPDLERFMAKRMGAKTVEVKASHLSLISQPDTIANLILEAAG
jgi:pimeloyl-ACP methyl ester carboxylesterase